MTEGEGVRVHDESRRFAPGLCFFKVPQVAAEAVATVLHKDEGILYPGDLVKAEIAENFALFTLV